MIKETVAKGKGFGFLVIREKLLAVLWHFVTGAIGFLMARTTLVGGMMPLGSAFAAGVPKKYIYSSALGSVLGYLVPPLEFSTLKYTAVLLAVVSIRLLTSGLKGKTKNAVWAAITSATVLISVNLVSLSANLSKSAMLGVAEGLIAGGLAYFFRRSGDSVAKAEVKSTEQTACLLISISVLLTTFHSVQFDGVSLGHIASFTLVLLTAKYKRVGASAVTGVASAVSVIISGGQTTQALVMCFAGLLAGAFQGFGKLFTALTPSLAAAVWVLISSAHTSSVKMLIETLTAGVIFILIPRTVTAGFGSIISPAAATPDTKGLRRTLTMRLRFASAALHGVTDTVDDVARCLAVSKRPNFNQVLLKTEADVCKGCSFHSYCWEKQRKTTVDAILSMSETIRRGQPIELAELPEDFSDRCLRIERFEDALTRNYTNFLSEISAEKRVSEMRELVAEQMNGIADMLSELADEFQTAQKYDVEMAARVSSALKDLDLTADECSCVVDRFGRMTVEVRLSQPPEIPINRARILERLQNVCDRDFEPPEINKVGKIHYITATEKAVFSVDCACTQLTQGKNQHCGDTCRYFFDGRGRLVALLSDGMGSGGRAAVDSAMTVGLAERLIKAGFGYDCTLRLVNSAMLYKSTDESLSTLDISCIDLFNGRTELMKAGAAPTIVRRNGRTGRAECKSLPAGILHEVGFDRAVVTLKEGDVLVMMSDGASFDGTDWICAEIEAFEGDAKQLSERLATVARRRRHDGHDDDITVFTALIERAI